MINIIKLIANSIICIGDIHGNFNFISFFIKEYDIKDAILIFCGDIGLGFNKRQYYTPIFKKLNTLCASYNTHCIFMRGNHDDPAYFTGDIINYSNIKAVPDYTVIQRLNESNEPQETGLLVGGGLSIDRTYRKAQYDKLVANLKRYGSDVNKLEYNYYWEDEMPQYKPEIIDDCINSGVLIDFVCTHTAPSFCQPTTKYGIQGWMELDAQLENDSNLERQIITDLFNKVYSLHPVKCWYNGHFHHHVFDEHYGVKFYALDMFRTNFDTITVNINKNNEN